MISLCHPKKTPARTGKKRWWEPLNLHRMNSTDLKRYIADAALPLTALEETTPIPGKRGLELGISGVLQSEGIELKVLVGVGKDFPASKPGFFLLNGKQLPRIPHVDDDGYICYVHDDNIVMDIHNP